MRMKELSVVPEHKKPAQFPIEAFFLQSSLDPRCSVFWIYAFVLSCIMLVTILEYGVEQPWVQMIW